MNFSPSYFYASVTGAMRANGSPQSLRDIKKGDVVAYTKGTSTAQGIEQRNPAFQDKKESGSFRYVYGNDHQESFNLMSKGKAKVFFNDDLLLISLIAQQPNPKDFYVLDERITIEPYGLMTRKNDVFLSELVFKTVREDMLSGNFSQRYEKWFLQPIAPNGVVLSIPISSLLKEQIRTATNIEGN